MGKKTINIGLYALRRLRRLGLRKTAVGAMRLCAVFLRHILTAAIKELLRNSFIAAVKTSHTTGMLCAILARILCNELLTSFE
jgi:hypothetical protein